LPIAVTTEQLAMADSVRQWARRADTIAAVRELETTSGHTSKTHWATANWTALAELGVFSIALPSAQGGSGGTTSDVAVVAEQLAATLTPGPVLPTLLAGLVLASLPAEHGANGLLTEIASGAASVAVALAPGGIAGARTPEGGLRVTGTASLVLGGGDTSHLLLAAETDEGETWFVIDGEPGQNQPRLHVAPRAPVDFSRALADVTVDDLEIPPGQVLTGLRQGLVAELAVTLAAAEAAAIAAWCVRTAADYARDRRQFGQPIGSFQAIKHLCAGMLCRSEQASALAAAAATAADQAQDELPLAAAAAAALALDAAVDNAKDAIQVLGGIGFTWEHDAHLYLRRALALRQLLGGSARWRARAVSLALEGARRHPPVSGKTSSQIDGSDLDDVRKAARLAATALSAVAPERRRRGLAEVGYMAPSWPKPYGLSASQAAQIAIDEELAAAGITRPDIGIGGWAIPAIANHGTTEQLERFAEATLRGDITWCQLFSEPEAGSDLASLRTKAVKTDRGWLLSGQKVWTSLAAQADWAICLARIEPADRTESHTARHKGITYFLVPMKGPGIEIRPLREMTGRRMFNEVFLDEVFVPDDCVVGQPGDGWRIARTTLATERVAMSRGGGLSKEIEELLAAAAVAGDMADDPVMVDQIGARLAECLALSVLYDRPAGGAGGSSPLASTAAADAGAGSAVRKLLGVAHRQAVAETALTLCGAGGAAADGVAESAAAEFLLTRCLSIAGGTSQILLTLVAERGLGLPRQEAR
jgi:alkylation response protein AidB-like acyl-CoA dehydrogenase